MNCEPILWKSLIRLLDNLITHDLSDLKWYHVQKQSERKIPLCFKRRQRSPITNLLLFLLWVADLRLIWKHANQLNVERNKAVWRIFNLRYKSHYSDTAAILSFPCVCQVNLESMVKTTSNIQNKVEYSMNNGDHWGVLFNIFCCLGIDK